jgi:hypothetical protein
VVAIEPSAGCVSFRYLQSQDLLPHNLHIAFVFYEDTRASCWHSKVLPLRRGGVTVANSCCGTCSSFWKLVASLTETASGHCVQPLPATS